MMNSSFMKCPPYCRVNCIIRHHPLLVALLNATDSDDLVLSKGKVQALDHVVKKYNETGWKLVDNIPDPVENFRYSLLHWASSMGRISATYWLITQGVPSTLKSNDTEKETPLHRALLCLQETCPHTSVDRFKHLLIPLEDCLMEQNDQGNTPLLACAEMLVNEMPRTEFYADCFTSMLDYVLEKKGATEALKLVNLKNNDGDNVLHILVTSGKQLAFVKRVVLLGANIGAFNKKGKTPMDISCNCGYIRTTKFLEAHLADNSVNEPAKKESGSLKISEMQLPGFVAGHKRASSSEGEIGSKMLRIDSNQDLSVDISADGMYTQQENEQSPGHSQAGGSSSCPTPSSLGDPTLDKTPSPSGSKPGSGGRDTPVYTSTRVSLSAGEREAIVRGTSSFKRLSMNTDKLLDKGRGPIRGMSTLSAPGAEKKVVKFLTGCSNITRRIFRNAIDADREILQERNEYLQNLTKGIQSDIVRNTEKQKTKVEGIQKLLDSLKQLQQEERSLDVEIKKMMVQLSQTNHATDGLRERLAHCEAALEVLASLSTEAEGKFGQNAANTSDTTDKVASVASDTTNFGEKVVSKDTVSTSDGTSSGSEVSMVPFNLDIRNLKSSDVIDLKIYGGDQSGQITLPISGIDSASTLNLQDAEALVEESRQDILSTSQDSSQGISESSQEV